MKVGYGTWSFKSGATYRVRFEKTKVGRWVFFLPHYARHRPAVRTLASGRVHEPSTHELFRLVLSNREGSVVHAGAFFGDMLPALSDLCSDTVWAFEPVLENYLLARLACEENQLSNVYLFHCALSDSFENVRMATSQEFGFHAGGSSRVSEFGTQTSPAVTLDGLTLEKVCLVHLDVEGHELQALWGARNLIERDRPVVAVEDNSSNCSTLLADLDYQLFATIPGVKVWLHENDSPMRQILAGFLNSR